jgi:NAD(P)H-dependent FMN reductase
MIVAVLQGSVRTDRLGDRVAKWVVAQLEKRGHEAHLVDAAQLNLPLLDRMWKEIKGDHHSELRKKLAPLAELYERADGFAIVSAEYNHSVPPGLTNLIDYFIEEYLYRPAAIVCYSAGPFGGVRAAMQLRALLPEVGMTSIPTIQPVPKAAEALSSDGIALTQDLAERSASFFDEFDWYMAALAAGRKLSDPRKNKG